MKRYLILLFISMACLGTLEAQTLRDYVRRGNRLMLDTLGGSDFSEKAIVQYKKALEKDSTFSIPRYNLGNALIRQGKPQDAMAEYLTAAKYEKDKQRLSDIYHNMGVLLQASKKYNEAVECYKESLRNDPSNDETRYNYVLAKWHLKNQQDDSQDGEDNKEDKQEQQKQEEKNKEEGQQKQEQPQPQQSQSQQQDKSEMSKENAERLLQAAMRNEKETQEKIQRQQQESPRRRLQKQW
ncbi:MAG: tetratricopeptide repeat protein [Bacteroidaceae bacterium]|nr:tetratricopeptide repeat protein [Bacteroidaceae bacterium]